MSCVANLCVVCRQLYICKSCDTPGFRWTLFKNYSKSENRKEYIQLIKRVHMYFFLRAIAMHGNTSLFLVKLNS